MPKLKMKKLKKRKFGGKLFSNVASKPTKTAANSRAAAWRKQGSLARVIKRIRGFDIFVHP